MPQVGSSHGTYLSSTNANPFVSSMCQQTGWCTNAGACRLGSLDLGSEMPLLSCFFLQSEIANSAWDTQIFHDYEETRAQQRAQFDTAVQEASFARTAGRQVIMIAVVNHKAARHHLPIFVSSLRAVGSLDRHLIVATIDPEAQALCQKVCNFNSIALEPLQCFTQKPSAWGEWWHSDCHKC